jgi:hypothetical protein
MGVIQVDNPTDRGSDTAKIIESLKTAVKQQ